MTLNAGHKVSPSPLLNLSSKSPDQLSARRRNTVGSPTSAVFKPGVPIPLPQAPHSAQTLYSPHSASQTSQGVQTNGFVARGNTRNRSKSPTAKATTPPRRQPNSEFVESGAVGSVELSNGRKATREHPIAPQSGVSNMQGRRGDTAQQPVTMQRPPFRSGNAGNSTISSSMPATPSHFPRVNGASRSPSPSAQLDSPRSTTSEPTRPAPSYNRPVCVHQPCPYETALNGARRRMPYSLGSDKLTRESPKVDHLDPGDEARLTEEAMREFEILKPSEGSDNRRRQFLEKLDQILNEEWPGHDTKVWAFGSTENYLAMEDSDVDVCITSDCEELVRQDGGGPGTEMWKTCKLTAALAKRGMQRLTCVPGAKVPIVKIWDPEYKVACDMNVNNTMAIENTRMIKTYVEIDDRVRPLALIIKNWTKQRLLNDAATGGTLSSYTWICLILNFLQTREPPILPCLHARAQNSRLSNGMSDHLFDDDIDSLRGYGRQNHETVGGLLFEFFKKYGYTLDYETSVISVRAGKLLTKKEKMWAHSHNNRLCVEEPFNTERNLGNTADDASMKGIHLEFQRAFKILSEEGDLAKCCERYQFPPEESHSLPVPPPSRPVILSKGSSTNFSRSRGGGFANNNQRGGRGYASSYRNNPNRRTANNSYNPSVVPQQQQQQQQQQQYYPDIFGYMPSAQEQLYALQAQLHAQQAHAQLLQQYQNQQNQQNHQHNSPPANSQISQEALHAFQQNLTSWRYFASLYGFNMVYPGFGTNAAETATAPTSPPRTPASTDTRSERHDSRQDGNRLGLGRGGRRNGNFIGGLRSQSQPPPSFATSSFPRGMPNGLVASEDDEYADNSSNGQTPETPPAEEPLDEYVGYYTIGGSLHPDVAVVDPQASDVEEPFVEQKKMVDRTKRVSQEKLPAPMLSREPSPKPSDRQNKQNHDSSSNQNNRSKNEDRKSAVTHGNGSFANPHRMTASTGRPVPFSGFDGASDNRAGSKEVIEISEQQLYAQRLLEKHSQASRSESKASTTSTQRLGKTVIQNGHPSPAAVNGVSSEEANHQTGPREKRPTQGLEWPPTRVSSAPPIKPPVAPKSKATTNLHDDLSVLTPVPEARTPSPSPQKTPAPSPQKTPAPKSAQKSTANGAKSTPKADPVPPTPADKTPTKNGNGRGKNSGNKTPGSNNNGNRNSEPKSGEKPVSNNKKSKWVQNRQPKRRNPPNSATTNGSGKTEVATPSQQGKETERKGG